MNERIFHCTGKEEIEEILEMLEESHADSIFFQFPRNSILFQQKTNLQKIVECAENNKKHVVMVTQNARARKEMQSMGLFAIAAIADAKNPSSFSNVSSPLPSIAKISTHPIDPEKFRKKRLEEEEFSEVVQKISKPSLHSLFLLGVIALLFFAFVIYIAIPSATISITPERKEIEMHLNTEMYSKQDFTENDLWKSNNGIFMIPVETTYEYKGVYTNVFKEVEGENATGTIEIINQTKDSILLKEGTRVQTKEGILFLLPTWVRLNAGDKKTIRVTASTEDVYRKVQADRANIKKGTIMIFPGLSTSLQEKIYAVSIDDFAGGRGTWKYSVTKKNLEDAKKEWEENASKKIQEEIDKKMQELNNNSPEERFVLITPIQEYIHREITAIHFDTPETILLGSSVPSFSGSITILVRVYAYPLSQMKDIIGSKFERLAPDGMRLANINTDILVITFQNVNSEKNKIKASVSTRGIYEYVVEPRSEKSAHFIQAAKQAILGKTEEEARTILLNNFKEVSDVDISLFPFWKNTLPSLPEKIEFEIL